MGALLSKNAFNSKCKNQCGKRISRNEQEETIQIETDETFNNEKTQVASSKSKISSVFGLIHYFYQTLSISKLYYSYNDHNHAFNQTDMVILRLTMKIIKNDQETVGIMIFMK